LEGAKGEAKQDGVSSLDEIQKYVADIMEQTREMSLRLRPSMLDDLGLLPTLQWHFDRYSRQTGIRIDFRNDAAGLRFPAEIETAAYRIVQEALTNVARYADVKEVFVGLATQAETLWLEIMDRGKGFDTATLSDRPTSGLGGMRERAVLVGGYLTVASFPGQGTQIIAALPLNGQVIERRKYDRQRVAG
jgi:signal transduction histidine kinase